MIIILVTSRRSKQLDNNSDSPKPEPIDDDCERAIEQVLIISNQQQELGDSNSVMIAKRGEKSDKDAG